MESYILLTGMNSLNINKGYSVDYIPFELGFSSEIWPNCYLLLSFGFLTGYSPVYHWGVDGW
jgi:hypothetical protein